MKRPESSPPSRSLRRSSLRRAMERNPRRCTWLFIVHRANSFPTRVQVRKPRATRSREGGLKRAADVTPSLTKRGMFNYSIACSLTIMKR